MVRYNPTCPADEDTNLTEYLSAPLLATYNTRIRPLLDTIDKLRQLQVVQKGIQLPTIVVVGDQSSGKSSVLESLAGINLPRSQGICTRVPLIMRLQNHPLPEPELYLEYHGKVVPTDEIHIAEDIRVATDEVAGIGKVISHTPLTLVVKKKGVPDLTMVDLPGITRVPVLGQPEDIYEQVSNIIMEYITPKESIILNVLSATVDFSTCESIRMSQRVDKTGERTLAVVTKTDKAPEGLQEKVTADDVHIGLGYVCVRNRIGDESCEEGRCVEKRLFESHPLLSKIDKSSVGIPVLAEKLVQYQANSIKKWLPDIVKKINRKLNESVSELEKMPPHLSSFSDAMLAFMKIVESMKDSLRKIIIRGEFDEYLDEKDMHCKARMAEMLNEYSKELQVNCEQRLTENFLMEEIMVLEEAKGIGLPNFLPRTVFLTILQRKVKEELGTPVEFIDKVWDYIERVVVRVLMEQSKFYPQLESSTRRAGENLMEKMRERSAERVKEMVDMEKLTDYTCNPEYMTKWNCLMKLKENFIMNVKGTPPPTKISLEFFGEVKVGHLREYPLEEVQQAFDMKMRITTYWKIVLQRLVDNLALYLLYSFQNLVNKELEEEMVKEVMGTGGLEWMLEEPPSMSKKRDKLHKSIKLFKESKQVIAKVMDRIPSRKGVIIQSSSMAGLSLKCGNRGALLKTVEETPEHDELTSHSNFSESTEAVLNLVYTTRSKPCRSKTESDLHTKITGHTDFVNKTSKAAKPISLEVPKPPVESEEGVIADGSSQPEEMVIPEVDKKLLGELEAMGFPKARATRGLHYSGNASLEAAVIWVGEHENDPDIDQMPMESDLHTKRTGNTVFVNKTSEAAKPISLEVPRPPADSEEGVIADGSSQPEEMIVPEVDKKLLGELEAMGFPKARATRALHYSGNASLEAAVIWVVEHENDPNIDQMPMSSLPVRPATTVERMRGCLQSLKHHHKDDDAKVKRAFQTLLTYVGNVAKNPNEDKFRKIRLNNASFQDKIGSLQGGVEFLELCGFEKIEGGKFLFLPRDKVDMVVLNLAGSELNSAIVNPFFGVL